MVLYVLRVSLWRVSGFSTSMSTVEVYMLHFSPVPKRRLNEEERFIVPDHRLFLMPPPPSQVDIVSSVLGESLLVSQSPH